MSVTITIANNHEYCTNNGLDGSVAYPCNECDDPLRPDKNCRECNGTGRVKFTTRPFELNIANRNFATLWSALGFDAEDYCGSMDGRILHRALDTADFELVRRDGTTEQSPRVQFVDCGISKDQAARYINALALIAEHAVQREEQVVWG